MIVSRFGNLMESFCPAELAEPWDNCGFQIAFENKEVNRVLVSLEVTDKVIEEAVKHNAQVIVTHHPLLFTGLKEINDKNIIGNHVMRLIKEEISVYSCHTNFDKMENGNNDYFGKVAEMRETGPVEGDQSGFLRRGRLPYAMKPDELKTHLGKCLGINREHIRVAGKEDQIITDCGWCTGAGSEFADTVFSAGCQCYITGDLKYHEVQEAEFLSRTYIDAGHYGTEKIFTPNMAQQLREKTEGKITIIESETDINPFVLV